MSIGNEEQLQWERVDGAGAEMIARREKVRAEDAEFEVRSVDVHSVFGIEAIDEWQRYERSRGDERQFEKMPASSTGEEVKNPFAEVVHINKRHFDSEYTKVCDQLGRLARGEKKSIVGMFTQNGVDPEQASIYAEKLAAAKAGEIPVEPTVLIPVLEARAKRMERFANETKDALLKSVPAIRSKIEQAIVRKEIPANKKNATALLNAIDYEVVDPLTALLDDKSGDYHTDTHRVRVAAGLVPEVRDSTLSHEMIHAIAGRTEYKFVGDDMENNLQRRGGLHFGENSPHDGDSGRPSRGPRFRWLNEAITERLSLIATGKDRGTYREEREVLAALEKIGIPWAAFTKAYFESAPAEPKEGRHPTPGLKKLFAIAEKKLGKRGLVDLDAFVETQGIKAVHTYLQAMGPELGLLMMPRPNGKRAAKSKNK